jgi:hypothetical protein
MPAMLEPTHVVTVAQRRFRVRRQLGEGGFAVVYLVEEQGVELSATAAPGMPGTIHTFALKKVRPHAYTEAHEGVSECARLLRRSTAAWVAAHTHDTLPTGATPWCSPEPSQWIGSRSKFPDCGNFSQRTHVSQPQLDLFDARGNVLWQLLVQTDEQLKAAQAELDANRCASPTSARF